MGRKVARDYGFTTTPDDEYLSRVLDEAAPGTNVIITHDRDTSKQESDEYGSIATLSVRNYVLALGLVYPELTLAGKPLLEWLLDLAEDERTVDEDLVNGWSTVTGEFEDVSEELDSTRHEVRRINNLLHGRTIRVNVESY